MKKVLAKAGFRNEIMKFRPNNFSYKGLGYLFEALEQFEDETGTEIEFDAISICCDFTEYESFEELQQDYDDIEDIEDLKDYTWVVVNNNDCIIVQAF